jgi:hypothetical protein
MGEARKIRKSSAQGPVEISSTSADDMVVCEICGKTVPASEVWGAENNNVLCCRECRAEEENCGCSD